MKINKRGVLLSPKTWGSEKIKKKSSPSLLGTLKYQLFRPNQHLSDKGLRQNFSENCIDRLLERTAFIINIIIFIYSWYNVVKN